MENAGGYYYLHTNGDLIYKRFDPGEDVSDLVRRVWPVDIRDRATAWRIVLEGLALGARVSRVRELATKWGCTAADFLEYLCRNPTPGADEKAGADPFLREIAGYGDPEVFWSALMATPKGQQPVLPVPGGAV